MKTMHRVRPRRVMPRGPVPPPTRQRWIPVEMRRRTFMTSLMLGASALALSGCKKDKPPATTPPPPGVYIPSVKEGESVFRYIERTRGGFDQTLYRQIIGAANAYKEGDEAAGLAAADDASRANARLLLHHTRIGELRAHPLFEDGLFTLIEQGVDPAMAANLEGWKLGDLKAFLLDQPEEAIKAHMPGLGSDVIACVVKLMSNEELIAVGGKLFNPLPGSKVGAKGYLGARIQPNSPTDHPDDIRWQVFDGWSYAVGDVVLGTNPVSSEVSSVAAVENALKDVLDTFGLTDVMPHCVLSHIDIQAEVEKLQPGTTGALVPEPRRHRGRQRDVRRHHSQDAGPRGAAHRQVRPLLRDRPGRRRHQRSRRGLRHGDARVAQVRLRARAQAARGRGRSSGPAAPPRPGSTSTTWPASSAPRCSAPASSSCAAASRTSSWASCTG